jgi:ABC-type multidrug transport system fused ATPase/permease subunit
MFLSRGFGTWRLAVLWLLGAITAVLSLITPQQTGKLTNLFTSGSANSWPTVRNAVLIMVASQLGISALSYFRRRVQVIQTQFMSRKLTLTIISRLLRFSPDFFRDSEAAKINNKALEDSDRVATFWVDATVGVPLAIVSVIFFGTIMIVRNPLLGSCMVPLSLLSGYYVFFDRKIQAVNSNARKTWDRIRTEAHELVSSVAEFRNHNAFDYGTNNLDRGFGEYQLITTDIGKLTALFAAANPFISCIQTGMLYFIGAALCLRGTMQWGDVISFLLLAQLFQKPVSDVAGFGLAWRMSRESVRRISEILDRPIAFEEKAGAPILPERAEFVFDKVSVNTETGGVILNSFAEVIRAGEHVAMCGPAGCGKTTTMQLIVRNIFPSSGHILASGNAIESYDLNSTARNIGFVPQKPVILNTSLRNNLLLGLRRGGGSVLNDFWGQLDVRGLADVKSMEDLNRRLIRAIVEVGLEADIFRKCMDSIADSVPPDHLLVRNISELRGQIAGAIGANQEDFVALNAQTMFPGTVGENLFGPGLASEAYRQEVIDACLRILREQPILQELLNLGWNQVRSEQVLTARIINRMPGLIGFVKSKRGRAWDEISSEVKSTDQSVLLEAALETQSLENFADNSILQARKMLMDADEAIGQRWKSLESNGVIMGLTMRENLLLRRSDPRRRDAAEHTDAAIREVLVKQGLLGDALLLGLEVRAGEDGNFLSGGQKQKLALARILMKNPNILLLDEATSAMDEISQRRIVDLVRKDFYGKTVLSISHRYSTVRDYDRILVLDRGRVVESGPFDKLVEDGGLLAQMMRQESGKDQTIVPTTQSVRAQSGAAPADLKAEIVRQLALCPLFAELSGDKLALLARTAKVFEFHAGEILFNRGDAGEQAFVLLAGQVEFFMPAEGGTAEKVIARYENGRVFGELAIFGSGTRSLSARAAIQSRVAAISRETLLPMMAAEPQISLGLLRSLSQRVIELTQ